MLLLALAACTTWIDQKPACKYDVYDWSDDLLAHILTGPGDGTFDYDPEDTPRNRIAGRYKPASGDFTWETGYADEYWLKAASVAGYGTAYHDGDLDILYTTTSTDVLGVVSDETRRVLREGCNMVVESWTDDDVENAFVETGAYDAADSYHWESSVPGYHFQGGSRQNLSYTWNQDADNGTYSESYAWAPSGKGEGVWSGECLDTGCSCEASYVTRFDGGAESDIVITCDDAPYADYHDDYDYDGSGTARYTYPDGGTCDLVTDQTGNCRYTCSDGSEGSC
jgi:hypothetical protein